MKIVNCSRCQSFIQADELRYIVAVHVTLDTDGFNDQPKNAYDVAAQLARGEEGLTEVFSREMAFTVCVNCREHFVNNPLNCGDTQSHPDLGLLQ